MSSITGLGLRNKVGIGKKDTYSSPAPKPQGSTLTGLGLRNKAAGITGKQRGDPDAAQRTRVTAPISSLKDPSSFEPPPKNINFHNAAVADRQLGKLPRKRPLTPAEYQAREDERITREKEQDARDREARRLEREERERARLEQLAEQEQLSGPVVPRRLDTTGLSTSQFAPPVARRGNPDGSIAIRQTGPTAVNAAPKPSLPPRLPNRQNTAPISPPVSASEPPYRVQHNPSPAYGAKPQPPPRTPSALSSNSTYTAASTPRENAQLNELQSRFASMRTSSNDAESSGPASWRPSSQRNVQEEDDRPIEMKDETTVAAKKAPPQPKPKKAGLTGVNSQSGAAPPPVPLSSKPR